MVNISSEPTLKRTLGLPKVTLMGIGIILGAGIYVLVGESAGLAGNSVWLSFLIAAIIAGLSGLSYAELSSMFPTAGAEYDYSRNAFGKKPAFVVGWLIVFGSIVATTAVAIGFGGYLKALTGFNPMISAFLLIALSALIAFIGVNQSVSIAAFMTLIEAFGLIAIILIGLPFFGTVNFLEFNFGFAGIMSGAALIFFAFIGFEDIVRMSEETLNAEKLIPKALILSIVITTIIYILVALSAVSVLGFETLASSSSPLADVAATAWGSEAGIILAIIALFSTGNTVLLLVIASSRILYGMAKQTSLPNAFAKIHEKTRTPWVSILAVLITASLFLLSGGLSFVANVTNFALFIVFIVINASVIKLRYSKPETKRAFRIPLSIGKFPVLPALGVITCVGLMTGITQDVLILGSIITLIGIIIAFLVE